MMGTAGNAARRDRCVRRWSRHRPWKGHQRIKGIPRIVCTEFRQHTSLSEYPRMVRIIEDHFAFESVSKTRLPPYRARTQHSALCYKWGKRLQRTCQCTKALALLICSRRNPKIPNALRVFLPLKNKQHGRTKRGLLKAFVYKSAGEWQRGFTVQAIEQQTKANQRKGQ